MAFPRIRPDVLILALVIGIVTWLLFSVADATLPRRALDLPVVHADETLGFFDTGLGGTDFVWCIDRSASMGWSGEIAALRIEILSALEQLTPANRFSLVAFSDSVTVWEPDLVPATPLAIASASAFVDGLSAFGATCLTDGLASALEIAEQTTGEVSVILIGDGVEFCAGTPSGGTPPAQLVAAVSAVNPDQIPIHCFHLSGGGNSGIPTYQALANEFGGVFVDTSTPTTPTASVPFIRGDVNGDGVLELSDVVVGLAALFQGQVLACEDAGDSNDDGTLDVADPVYSLLYLFSPSGAPPPAPFPNCAKDLTCDGLECTVPSVGCPQLDFVLAGTQLSVSSARDTVGGDFNGDGMTDLAVSCLQCVQFFFGAGGGTFTTGPNILSPVVGTRMAAEDFDGDGNLDVLVAGMVSGIGELFVLLGAGDGTFSTVSSPLSADVRWLDTGDVNNDGITDAVTGSFGFGAALISLGNGDGTFSPGVTLAGMIQPIRTWFCDANGDGLLDVATLDRLADQAHLFIGDGTGGFGPSTITPLVSSDIPAIAVGDLTSDGLSELVVMEELPNQVVVRRNGGVGVFVELSSTPLFQFSSGDVTVGDVDLDGAPDIVVIGNDELAVLVNDGSGGFSVELVLPSPVTGNLEFVRLIDVDDDGDLDCVTRWTNGAIQIAENEWIP